MELDQSYPNCPHSRIIPHFIPTKTAELQLVLRQNIHNLSIHACCKIPHLWIIIALHLNWHIQKSSETLEEIKDDFRLWHTDQNVVWYRILKYETATGGLKRSQCVSVNFLRNVI